MNPSPALDGAAPPRPVLRPWRDPRWGLAVLATLALGGCTGIVLGRAGPGRGTITLTTVTQTPGQRMSHTGTQRTVGATYNSYLVAAQVGPSWNTLTGRPSESGAGLDVYANFLHNRARRVGFGVRAGYSMVGNVTDDDAARLSYAGFPIMLEAAIGTRMPGRLDTERKVLGSISGLALSAHAAVGYLVAGSIKRGTTSADAAGYRASLGLRLTLPVTIFQFTLTAELARMASTTVALDGVDASYQSTSILFGNLVAF